MENKHKKNNFTRQIYWHFLSFILVTYVFAAVICIACFKTTVIYADEWNKRNDKMMERFIEKPLRGNILTGDGKVLATTEDRYTLRIDYRSERFQTDTFLESVDALSDSLATYFTNKTKTQWIEYLTAPLNCDLARRPRAYLIARNLTAEEIKKVRTWPFFSIRSRLKSGLVTERNQCRLNPYGNLANSTIGVVIEDSFGEKRGACGLEKGFDSYLYGRKGVIGNPKAINGDDIITTIDIDAQQIAENELETVLVESQADWGTVVVMDVKSGDIVAIANLDSDSVSGLYVEGINHAVLNYEPGSTFKAIPLTIALEDNIVCDENRIISTGSHYNYAGGRAITDVNSVSGMAISEFLERSTNIGVVKVMEECYDSVPSLFRSRLEATGFLDAVNVGIPGEMSPNIPVVKNNREGRIALSRQFIGYSTEVSPLSLLAWYNALANDGIYVRPRLVKGILGNESDSVIPVSYVKDRLCSEKNAAIMRSMLERVVWGKAGTARILRDDSVKIAGKTGTCYIVEDRFYNKSKRRVGFVGYFPADNPKYSCIVVVSNPTQKRSAASVSGFVVKNIAIGLKQKGMI